MIIKLGGSLWLFDPSEAPEGSLIIAKNVVMDREGIIEPRKGSSKGSQTSANPVLYMLDSEGDRYSWADTLCYKNEASFGDTLTAARPEAVRHPFRKPSTRRPQVSRVSFLMQLSTRMAMTATKAAKVAE